MSRRMLISALLLAAGMVQAAPEQVPLYREIKDWVIACDNLRRSLLPDDIHDQTRPAAEMLAGQGLMGIARDNYGGEGSIYSWVAGFALVELDTETGMVELKEYLGVTDCGTVLHPRSLGAQVLGGSIQGMGMAMTQRWVFDPKWGVPFAHRFLPEASSAAFAVATRAASSTAAA